jgi:hypothetical protein
MVQAFQSYISPIAAHPGPRAQSDLFQQDHQQRKRKHKINHPTQSFKEQ